MKPAFSYYGGKQRMSRHILPLIPKHTVYVEPFAGGAALFFAKPRPLVSNSHNYREVLNDMHGEIVNFYRVLQDKNQFNKLLHRLIYTPYAREEHKFALYGEHVSKVDRAWAWFVNIQMSFSNAESAGWRTNVMSKNIATVWRNQVHRLHDCHERMSGVHVECGDAIEIIQRWDSPQTLFYCDPPYPGAGQSYTHRYSHDDFAKLVKALDGCQGSFLLSAYDVGLCPEHWERFDFSAVCSASGKGQTGEGKDRTKKATLEGRERTEVVWRMDRSMTARSEIIKLYESNVYDCFGGPIAKQLDLFA